MFHDHETKDRSDKLLDNVNVMRDELVLLEILDHLENLVRMELLDHLDYPDPLATLAIPHL